MPSNIENYPFLATIARGRDHLTTVEFGLVLNRTGQTIRKNLCLDGDAYGVRPVKLGGRLLWPVADIIKLLDASVNRKGA